MTAIPVALTSSCITADPELVVRMKWPAKERKTPAQNTASDCSPHLTSGLKMGRSSRRLLSLRQSQPGNRKRHDDEVEMGWAPVALLFTGGI